MLPRSHTWYGSINSSTGHHQSFFSLYRNGVYTNNLIQVEGIFYLAVVLLSCDNNATLTYPTLQLQSTGPATIPEP